MSKRNRKKILYIILFIELIIIGYILLRDFKITNSINLSKIMEFFIIIFLSLLSYLIIKSTRKKFEKNKYSYNIVTLLGLLIFFTINILRHAFLLVYNWNIYNQHEIYKNTLRSFSGFIVSEAYYTDNNELRRSTSDSVPYKFTFDINNEKLIKCETTEDGNQYNISIKNMFPKSIWNEILNYVDDSNLQDEVDNYYKDILNKNKMSKT